MDKLILYLILLVIYIFINIYTYANLTGTNVENSQIKERTLASFVTIPIMIILLIKKIFGRKL